MLQFGGKLDDNESIIAVNMDGRTILLYNLNECDNALELAFQSRYGLIVSNQWFGDGNIIVSFESGSMVVISTRMCTSNIHYCCCCCLLVVTNTTADMADIGREQCCGQFHNDADPLVAMSHNNKAKQVATCGESSIKLIDMQTLKVTYTLLVEKEFPGVLTDLQWTSDGRILSVCCSSGCLYTFSVSIGGVGGGGSGYATDKHSLLKLCTAPLSLSGILATVVVIVVLFCCLMVNHFDMSLLDVVNALFGLSVSV